MAPQIYTADEIKNWDISSSMDGKIWVCARATSRPRKNRFYLAWMVLIGRFDALKWNG